MRPDRFPENEWKHATRGYGMEYYALAPTPLSPYKNLVEQYSTSRPDVTHGVNGQS